MNILNDSEVTQLTFDPRELRMEGQAIEEIDEDAVIRGTVARQPGDGIFRLKWTEDGESRELEFRRPQESAGIPP